MKALLLFFIIISPLLAKAQSTLNTDCGNDYLCFYQRQAQELESYRYQQLEFQEQQLNEMRRQNSLLEQELQQMNNRQTELENNYLQLQQELEKQEAAPGSQETQEEQLEEDQFRIEEIP